MGKLLLLAVALGTYSDLPHLKSYSYIAPAGGGATAYLGGWLQAPAASSAMDETPTNITYGTANVGYAGHVFIVASGPGSASGGSGTVGIKVTGTSITDAGVRSAGDSETFVADITTLSTNQWAESSKKFLGQVTISLDCSGGCTQTTYSATVNYGYSKYDDWGNHWVKITDIECVGFSDATDSGFDIEFIHHKSTGWTYHASAFVPGPTASYSWATDHNTEVNLGNDEHFAWKRADLSLVIDGNDSEGFMFRVTTGSSSVGYMNCHVGIHDL